MTSMGAMWHAARNPPRDPTNLSFKDKAVLVTGANSGLGHEAAIKYARQGANPLILGVRTQEKGEQAKADIIRATGVFPDIFIIETVEMTQFASVKEFAERINARVPKLHVLQLVAGVSVPSFKKSPEGYELGLQISILSTALMAFLLLPKVRETAAAEPNSDYPPHITFVNSIASLAIDPKILPEPSSGETLIQRINNGKLFDNVKEYFLVKLGALFVVRGLTERLGSEKIVVNATCPGMCKTNMGRDFPFVAQAFMAVFYIFFGRSAEQGARSLVSATGLGLESKGQFWVNDEIQEPSELLKSERGNELYHETWDEIKTILKPYINLDAI